MNKFIHQSVVVYMALIMLIRMMAMPLSLLDYSLNKQFIADNLCENRAKPDMHCGGSCYLNKQLAKSNESQESNNQQGTLKNIVTDFFEPVHSPDFTCIGQSPVFHAELKAVPLTNLFAGNIFHPPIV